MTSAPQPADFADIARLIDAARQRAVQAVNTTLIELYWQIGERISRRIAAAEWGDGVVDQLARYLARTQPGLRGFTRANLFRMRQFYEAYPDAQIVSALLRQLPWTHNLIILSQAKRHEGAPTNRSQQPNRTPQRSSSGPAPAGNSMAAAFASVRAV